MLPQGLNFVISVGGPRGLVALYFTCPHVLLLITSILVINCKLICINYTFDINIQKLNLITSHNYKSNHKLEDM